jgi:hypothetical protein
VVGLFALLLSVSLSVTRGEDIVTETEESKGRDSKGKFCCIINTKYFLFNYSFLFLVLPIFQVVRFPVSHLFRCLKLILFVCLFVIGLEHKCSLS